MGGRGVDSKMVRVKYPESWGWLAVTLALTTAAVTGKKETYSASAICAEFLHTKYRKVGRDYVHGSIARFRAHGDPNRRGDAKRRNNRAPTASQRVWMKRLRCHLLVGEVLELRQGGLA